MNDVGIFQCTKCKALIRIMKGPGVGWDVACPNKCKNKIKYDKYPAYFSEHKYFKWLNYKE